MLPGLLLLCRSLSPAQGVEVQTLVEKSYPNSERLKEIRMGDIVRGLEIGAGSRLADVGCGPGEFSVILSKIVGPRAKVDCEDISEETQRGLPAARAAMKKWKAKNVAVLRGEAGNPKLPVESLDAVLIVNAYH